MLFLIFLMNTCLTEEYFTNTKNKQPRPWEELAVLVSNSWLHLIGREPSVTEAYEKYAQQIQEEWVSIGDYILHRYFDVEVELHVEANTNKQKKIAIMPVVTEPPQYRITVNDFPYMVASNITHRVLWCLRPLEAAEIEEILKREGIDESHDLDVLWKRQGENYRSVKNIWHVHIFFTNRKEMI